MRNQKIEEAIAAVTQKQNECKKIVKKYATFMTITTFVAPILIFIIMERRFEIFFLFLQSSQYTSRRGFQK